MSQKEGKKHVKWGNHPAQPLGQDQDVIRQKEGRKGGRKGEREEQREKGREGGREELDPGSA